MSEHVQLIEALDARVQTRCSMSRRVSLVRLVARPFVFMAALLVAASAICRGSIAAEPNAAPRIGQVQLGIKNHFKVGFWTPVVVEIEGAVQSATEQIEVTVNDSDGVPTTASAKPAAVKTDREVAAA